MIKVRVPTFAGEFLKKEHVSLTAAVDDVKQIAQQCSAFCKENLVQQRAVNSRQGRPILVSISGSLLRFHVQTTMVFQLSKTLLIRPVSLYATCPRVPARQCSDQILL